MRSQLCQSVSALNFFVSSFCVTRKLSTLRQITKVPSKPCVLNWQSPPSISSRSQQNVQQLLSIVQQTCETKISLCGEAFSTGCAFSVEYRTQAAVVTAIKRLKNNKFPGVCNILPEMLKYGGDSVHAALYRVILGIWRTEQAPQDFKQDILLPVPKKGDASLCSNYRTIALQSIAGKASANVLSARLSEWLADNLLDEHQTKQEHS